MKWMIPITTALLLMAGAANAALLSRAGGQAYYDDVLNITWLGDANYAQTTYYDSDGWMTWYEAQTWIESLNAEGGTGYLGANDWRLPETLQPDASCSIQYFGQSSGGGCTGSEMGHLYYVDGIESLIFTSGPFSRVESGGYWSGTTQEDDPGHAWRFAFSSGIQDHIGKNTFLHAWAVRPGDIAEVPVPGAVWLLATGVAALGVRLRRRTSLLR
jgi:hypothetical protein